MNLQIMDSKVFSGERSDIAGWQSRCISKDMGNLVTTHVLSVAALTREDHRKLAKHYSAHAADHIADAKYHERLPLQYDDTLPQLASEARHYAAHSMEAAEALRNLATQHGKLGK